MNKKLLLSGLTLAVSSVLNPALANEESTQTSEKNTSEPWQFEAGVLYYGESDGRVQAFEPVFTVKKNLSDEKVVSGKLTLDLLTGPSHNGATYSDTDQIFTSPSGRENYTIKAGERPVYDQFKDARVALSGNFAMPLGEDGHLNTGANLSVEHDYFSLGANANYSHDLNQNNTTLNGGLSFAFDTIKPEGSVRPEFGLMGSAARDTSDTKTTIDALIGVTQVLDKKTLLQVNYSLGLSNGYHTDPYKFVSETDNNGRPTGTYLYEKRPDSRTRNSLYAVVKRNIRDRDVLETSYRFYTDDWGIQAHTLDAKYRLAFGEKSGQYIAPHLRYYQQNEADFYRLSLDQGAALPEFASADSRLSAFNAYTIGLEYGNTWRGKPWSIGLEYYTQQGKTPDGIKGIQSNYDQFQGVDAIMLQYRMAFDW